MSVWFSELTFDGKPATMMRNMGQVDVCIKHK
jgi:hypothetical protein